MQSIVINRISLHYRWRPAAGRQTLVFINSLGTDFRIWDEVVEELGGEVSTLVYDKRGHGLSDLGDVPCAMDDHITDLEGLMERLGAGHAILCGLSVGGQVALGLAGRRPDLVTGLILCDTAPKIGTLQSWNERIDSVAQGGIASIAEMVLARWFTPGFRRGDNPLFAMARNMLLRQSVAGYAATCAAIRDTDLTAVASSLQIPVICIVGGEDGATPPDLVEAMARIIPGASFHIIKACGHIPPVERPGELTALITGFLGKHASG